MKAVIMKYKNGILIHLGCVAFALAYLLFFDGSNIAPGGIGGLAVILSHLTGLSFGLFNIACNLPALIIGVLLLGYKRIAWTIYIIFLTSIMVDLGTTWLPGLSESLVPASLVGGIFHGLGIGLMVRAGGSIGGTTLIAQLVNVQFPKVRLSKLLCTMDGVIVLLSLMVFGNLLLAAASMLAVLVTNFVLDQIVRGMPMFRPLLVLLKKPVVELEEEPPQPEPVQPL